MTHQQQLESIIELAAVLSRQTDFNEILRLITERARALFGAQSAMILMVNPTTRETIKTLYKHGEPGGDRHYNLFHTYLTGWVIEHNTGFYTEEIRKDDRFRSDLFGDLPVRTALCSPFRGDGIIIGSLLILSPSTNLSTEEDPLAALDKFTAIASPFLRNLQKLQSFFEPPLPESTLVRKYEGYGLIGRSEPFIAMLKSVDAAAKGDVRVLLEGESGTGKELVAKAIHHGSHRAEHKFIAIDCGAIPRDLIESELFGHVRGAFTGATEARRGLLEEANRGTLFMDEISNLPMEMQSRLLRVLQENEVRPVGSNQTRKVDVRIIAASSKPLRQLLEKGAFREDLFFRLYVYPIEIPSLRERVQDIPLLTQKFLQRFAQKQGKKIETVSEKAMILLKSHGWNGNVRELENLVERMVTLAPPGMRSLEPSLIPEDFRKDLPEDIQQKITEEVRQASPQEHNKGTREESLSLQESLAQHEKRAIEQALDSCGWNQSAAARLLQVSEHTIRYKMKKLGIKRS
jgi:transcriptional regulator with GAF, ATPase, and Fis domain